MDKYLWKIVFIFCRPFKTFNELFSALRMELGQLNKDFDTFHSQLPDTIKEKIKEDMGVKFGRAGPYGKAPWLFFTF